MLVSSAIDIDLKSEIDIAKDEVRLGKNDLGDQVHVQVRKCGTNATKYVLTSN